MLIFFYNHVSLGEVQRSPRNHVSLKIHEKYIQNIIICAGAFFTVLCSYSKMVTHPVGAQNQVAAPKLPQTIRLEPDQSSKNPKVILNKSKR